MNAMDVYMRDVRRHSILSREEEMELTARYAETKDPRISARLVSANLRLVVDIASQYHAGHHDPLELIQEGNNGLVKAVDKFDHRRGIRFTSYASWWIRGYILKFIIDNSSLVRVGSTKAQRRAFFNLRKVRHKLEAAGQDGTAAELSAELAVAEQEVIAIQRGSVESAIPEDLAAPASEQPEALVGRRNLQGLLGENLRAFQATRLNDREADILRSCLLADEPESLRDAGKRYGICRERARQVQAGILSKLKRYLVDELGEAALTA